MIRRILVLAAVLAFFGVGVGFADDVVAVDPSNWNTGLALDYTGGGWGDGVTLDWVISKDAGAVYTYTYTWTDHVTSWVLETSPNVTDVSFAFSGGYTYSMAANKDVTDNNGNTVTLANAITFTPNDGTVNSYSFQTYILPVYGDAWGMITSADRANNPDIGLPVNLADGQAGLVTKYVPMPDSAYGGDIVIPEPSISVLALTALLGGAFARWRRRKED